MSYTRMFHEMKKPLDYKKLVLDKSIGIGGTSTVRKAFYPLDDKFITVAIKKADNFEEALELMENEKDILGEINNKFPNQLLQIYECESLPDDSLVMEYLPDGDFFDHINSNHYTWKWVNRLQMSLALAESLEALHNLHIKHGDIKVENYLMNGDKTKLCDFGFAKRMGNENEIHTDYSQGTLPVMAPEIFTREKAGLAADIYSLSICFFKLSTGRNFLPHVFNSKRQAIEAIAKAKKRDKLPSDCPKEFSDLIKDCWNHEPDNRPNANECITRIKEILSPMEAECKEGLKMHGTFSTKKVIKDDSPKTGNNCRLM